MGLSRINQSIIGRTDSYKVTQWLQLQPNTEQQYAYFESRYGEFPYTVLFGLYYYAVEYLERPITQADIDFWDPIFSAHFNDPALYNREGWEIILNEYGGYLPIRIKALPEGTVVPTRVPLYTVEVLDKRLAWLTTYVETLLSKVWYTSTVATVSRRALEIITKYANLTGSSPDGVLFKLHDFGYRGASSEETAGLGGAAHLINFLGTDTVIALQVAMAYYQAEVVGFSIPASEHSTMSQWGEDREVDAYRNMIQQFGESPTGIFACVSDTWDIQNAASQIWGEDLRAEVEAMSNMLVVRPDSGNVMEVVLDVITRLGAKFGYTLNETGFKVLNNVRVIQGDGMDLGMIERVCHQLYAEGWAIENVAFGMGAGLLQKVNRDTQGFAYKVSSSVVAGREFDVFKRPATDPQKNSQRGRFAVVRSHISGELEVRDQYDTAAEYDLLETVFQYGKWVVAPPKFADIRERAALS